jgi:cyanophycin synthetase
VRRYLGAGGIAFYLQGGTVWKAHADREEAIVSLMYAPITLGGRADHQMQNCLLACAGAVMLGLSHELVKNGILSFTENKGRMTMIDMDGYTVVLDYGHNPAGYLAVISAVKKLGAGHLIGVIGAAGDRTDDTLLALGRIAGKHFDKLYIKEDRDLRGRAKGETATILAQGAQEAGARARDMTLLLDERTAVRRALENAQTGDTIVIFYEDYDGTLAEIERKRGNKTDSHRVEEVPDRDIIVKTFDFSNKNAHSRQANEQRV